MFADYTDVIINVISYGQGSHIFSSVGIMSFYSYKCATVRLLGLVRKVKMKLIFVDYQP